MLFSCSAGNGLAQKHYVKNLTQVCIESREPGFLQPKPQDQQNNPLMYGKCTLRTTPALLLVFANSPLDSAALGRFYTHTQSVSYKPDYRPPFSHHLEHSQSVRDHSLLGDMVKT